MKVRYSLALGALFGAIMFAAGLSATHRDTAPERGRVPPPLRCQAWIERADNTIASTLTVWYDIRTKANSNEGEGTKYLKDLRQR